MRTEARAHDQLLSGRDAESFEEFYLRDVSPVLGYVARRTRDPELAADTSSVVDVASGDVRSSTGLPEFGIADMARVGDELWISSPSGHMMILWR